ncbi:GGDEF domain-containing protein [Permianibacter sp. IMCC34836]|uniref:GGDEF domain-containing protein n=1 Tax=Permianibacter fluminis TaxID=2738515 RepID=UPI001551A0E4|nr:GGDEF domain-containing protein [Permianibacter fluminis]NQD36376.1 GGDEF domain-containing protein [Permianibacter fluminis]
MTLMNGYTILILTGVMQLLAACASLLVHETGVTRQVLRWWVLAQVIAGIGHIARLVIDPSHLFLNTSLPNALISLSLAMMTYAMARLLQRQFRALMLVSVVIILLQLIARELTHSEAQRLLLASALITVQFFLLSYLYWRAEVGRRALTNSLMLGNAIAAVAMCARLWEAAHAGSEYNFSHAGLAQQIALVGYFSGMVVNGFGFLLILIDRGTEELVRLSSLDSLTETLNRRSFLVVAKQQLAQAERGHHPVSLLICDLDHFKQINDQHGHHAGDRMILALVGVARQTMRHSDSLARWGGEEFVLLLPQTDLAGARQIAERLNKAFAAITISHGQLTLHATVSIGIAERRGKESVEQTLDRADRALLMAKANGRNRVEVNS